MLLHYLFLGSPENLGSWVLLTLVYAIVNNVGDVVRSSKVEGMEQLTIDNYWKLKKELKGKVDRKGGRRKDTRTNTM